MGISAEEALDCFRSDDLIGIGMEADAIRRSLHPERVVSYLIDGRIAIAGESAPEGIYAQARESVDLGVTGLYLELARPTPPLAALEALLHGLRERFPDLWLHGLSASDIVPLAAAAGLGVRDTLAILRDAGLDSLAGDDATLFGFDIAVAGRCRTADWFKVHRTAHQLGLRSTASMVFGLGESLEQRVEHLVLLRDLQQETGGFTAFTPLSFRPASRTQVPDDWEPVTAVEYLRTLAISRMMLEDIPNIQSNGTAEGLKVVQVALRFGANDTGAISVTPAAAPRHAEEDIRRIIRDAGFRPAQRDTLYRTRFLD